MQFALNILMYVGVEAIVMLRAEQQNGDLGPCMFIPSMSNVIRESQPRLMRRKGDMQRCLSMTVYVEMHAEKATKAIMVRPSLAARRLQSPEWSERKISLKIFMILFSRDMVSISGCRQRKKYTPVASSAVKSFATVGEAAYRININLNEQKREQNTDRHHVRRRL